MTSWKEKRTEAHWHDLISTTLEEEVNTLAFTPPGGVNKGVRQATKEEEWVIVKSILDEFTKRADRISAWAQRTNKSEKAFERRWSEIKAQETEVRS